jgi:hypothetical protein
MSSAMPVSTSAEAGESQALRAGSALMGLGAIMFVAGALLAAKPILEAR